MKRTFAAPVGNGDSGPTAAVETTRPNVRNPRMERLADLVGRLLQT